MDVESVAAAVTALTFTGEYDGIVDDGEDENAPFHAVRLRVKSGDLVGGRIPCRMMLIGRNV